MADRAQNVRIPAPIPLTRSCDNPECGKRLKWATGRGRPPLYCSGTCRKRAVSIAGKLGRSIQSQRQKLASGDLTYRAERDARAELARLEWLLSMYPPSSRSSQRDGQ